MKKQMTTIAMILTAVGFMLNAAWAQEMETPSFHKKDMTLTLSGSGASSDDFDTNLGSVEAGLEHFFAESASASVRQGISFSDDENSDNNVDASTRLAMDFYMGNSALIPYIGANIGYLYGDTVEETFIAGPEAGLRAFITEDAFINFLVEYQFLFDEADDVDDNYDDGRFVYSLGFGVRFN